MNIFRKLYRRHLYSSFSEYFSEGEFFDMLDAHGDRPLPDSESAAFCALIKSYMSSLRFYACLIIPFVKLPDKDIEILEEISGQIDIALETEESKNSNKTVDPTPES